jgi:hypothetical protein
LVGACFNHAHHQIHGVEFGALQRLLAGLIPNNPAAPIVKGMGPGFFDQQKQFPLATRGKQENRADLSRPSRSERLIFRELPSFLWGNFLRQFLAFSPHAWERLFDMSRQHRSGWPRTLAGSSR